jgi:hypothetical protein
MVQNVKKVSERGNVHEQMQKQREQRNEKEGNGERGRMKQEYHLNPQAVYHYLILCRINFLLRMVSMFLLEHYKNLAFLILTHVTVIYCTKKTP